MASVFSGEKAEGIAAENEQHTEKLYAQIGQLKVENDWLKKNLRETPW
jgi:hypothetical protein